MRGFLFTLAVGLLIAVLSSCGASKNTCITGQSTACAGPGGCSGYQICRADGTLDPCICGSSPDGGEIDSGGMDANGGMDSSGTDSGSETGSDAGCMGSPPMASNMMNKSDPSPTYMAVNNGYVLHKELVGFADYGEYDVKSDIAYAGETAAWTFAIGGGAIKSAKLVLSLVLTSDMMYAPKLFTYRVWSGKCSTDTPTMLPHGTPGNTPGAYGNWVQITVDATPTANSTYRVELTNTSNLPFLQWIAIDWIELQVTTQ